MSPIARGVKFKVFLLVMWLVVAFCFNGVTDWHDWAIGIVTGGCAVSVFYRRVLKSPKARRYFQ